MSEETVTKKKTVSKKAPAKKATPKAEPKPKVVSFYFPKGDHSTFVWRTSEGDRVVERVSNKMIRILPSNPNANFIIAQLRADKRNSANGGNFFAEVTTGKSENSDAATRIEQLTAMDHKALVTLLGGDLELNRLTVGALIAKALDLD